MKEACKGHIAYNAEGARLHFRKHWFTDFNAEVQYLFVMG